MKKEWLEMAVFALTFAGCSQNEVTDVNNSPSKKNEIAFDLSTEKNGRAVDATLTTLQNDTEGFIVFATQTNGSNQESLIDNKSYAYISGQWQWKGLTDDNIPQWPTETGKYPVNFYAYHPANLLASGDVLSSSSLEKSITVGDVDKQIDILAANSTNVVTKPTNSKITFTFEHILSKIAFQANVLTETTAYIQAVSIHQVGNTRSFNFGGSVWSGVASSPTDYIFRTSPTAPSTTQIEITGTQGEITGDNDKAMMLMPQAYDSWVPTINNGVVSNMTDLTSKANIQMIYRMVGPSNKDVVGYTNASSYPDWATITNEYKTQHPSYDGGLYIKVAYPLQGKTDNGWLKGKSYTYIFQLGTPGATGGYLADDTFYDENGIDTGLKVKNPDGGGDLDPGTPPFATGGNIDFEIVVNEWNTTHGNAENPLN